MADAMDLPHEGDFKRLSGQLDFKDFKTIFLLAHHKCYSFKADRNHSLTISQVLCIVTLKYTLPEVAVSINNCQCCSFWRSSSADLGSNPHQIIRLNCC